MTDTEPGWLDEAFVKPVLGSVEGVREEQISMIKWQCKSAVPPGTNYLSLLYRLGVEYKLDEDNRSISLIVKIPLESGLMKDFMDKVNGYGKELKFYNEVLPRLYVLDQSVTVTARSYVCPLHNTLVLEDLGEDGYKMADRLKQLDLAHCKQFLISLAKLHGLSAALHQNDPELLESMEKSFWFREDASEEELKQNEQYLRLNLSSMLYTVKSLGLERYAEIIQGKIASFHNTMQQMFKPHGGLKVLTHGDCWTNNILFKYDDSNQVNDAKLVDFQMIKFGSYAQDLLYFWWTSANLEVQENSREEMFEVYLKTLNQTLEDLQVPKRLSKDEFDREIRRFTPYALFVCSSLLTIVMADPDDLQDFKDVNESEFEKPVTADTSFSKNYRSKYYKAVLPHMLRLLERCGAFD